MRHGHLPITRSACVHRKCIWMKGGGCFVRAYSRGGDCNNCNVSYSRQEHEEAASVLMELAHALGGKNAALYQQVLQYSFIPACRVETQLLALLGILADPAATRQQVKKCTWKKQHVQDKRVSFKWKINDTFFYQNKKSSNIADQNRYRCGERQHHKELQRLRKPHICNAVSSDHSRPAKPPFHFIEVGGGKLLLISHALIAYLFLCFLCHPESQLFFVRCSCWALCRKEFLKLGLSTNFNPWWLY